MERGNLNAVPTLEYLAWVSLRIAYDGGYRPDTWKHAIEGYEQAGIRFPLHPKHHETARAILAYFRGQSADEALTPHLADLITCLHKDLIRRDELALAASGALVYQRAKEREARAEQENKRRQTSRFVGARGEEIRITGGYISSHRDRPSPHTGLVHIYDIQGEDGNCYTYFADRRDLEPGWTYDLLADVKRHEEYRGINKTIVGNVRIARVVEEGSK